MTDWQPIESAPKDGTPIQARIDGEGDDYVIAWLPGFLTTSEEDCCCWVIVDEQEPPDSWCDGVCWESNSNGDPSRLPTHWKPLN